MGARGPIARRQNARRAAGAVRLLVRLAIGQRRAGERQPQLMQSTVCCKAFGMEGLTAAAFIALELGVAAATWSCETFTARRALGEVSSTREPLWH